jgi:hypothetical protein
MERTLGSCSTSNTAKPGQFRLTVSPLTYVSGSVGAGTRTIRADQVPHPDGTGPGSDPPGYSSTGLWNRRGHLVAQVLGGPGIATNIVAMTFVANQTNTGMRSIEDAVRDDIRKRGSVFDYKVTPRYAPPNQPGLNPPQSVDVIADEIYPAKQPGKFTKQVDNTK